MKKALFTLFMILSGFAAFSQGMPPVENLKLETNEDYRTVDSIVLRVSNILLTTPADQDYESRLKGGVFILRWIDGTPDFDFSSSQRVLKYVDKDVEVVNVYYAALSSCALQSKPAKDTKAITLNAVEKLVAYINNSNNHVRITKQLKKLSDAAEKGELKTFLKL